MGLHQLRAHITFSDAVLEGQGQMELTAERQITIQGGQCV